MNIKPKSIDFTFLSLAVFGIVLLSSLFVQKILPKLPAPAYASNNSALKKSKYNFVTIYDRGHSTQLKTSSTTVGELLKRANISISDSDIVEPSLESEINSSKFYINIYRKRPILIKDNSRQILAQVSSFDELQIIKNLNLDLESEDNVKIEYKNNLLLSAIPAVMHIERKNPIKTSSTAKTESTTNTNEIKNTKKYPETTKKHTPISTTNIPKITNSSNADLIDNTNYTRYKIIPTDSNCAKYARLAGVSEEELPIALDLIKKESNCNPTLVNRYSGAYGIPQSLPAEKMATAGDDWRTNPVTQIRWMIGYVKKRYGSWQKALEFWHCTGQCMGINKKTTWY